MKPVEQFSPPPQNDQHDPKLSRRQFLMLAATGATLFAVGTPEVAQAEKISYGGWKGETYYGKDGKFAGCNIVSGEPSGDIKGHPLKIGVNRKKEIYFVVTLDHPDPGKFADPSHIPEDKDFKVLLQTMKDDNPDKVEKGFEFNANKLSPEYDHEGERVTKVVIALGTKSPIIEEMKSAKNLKMHFLEKEDSQPSHDVNRVLEMMHSYRLINLRHKGLGLFETNDTVGAINAALKCVEKNSRK